MRNSEHAPSPKRPMSRGEKAYSHIWGAGLLACGVALGS
jgi:hypothetical protein